MTELQLYQPPISFLVSLGAAVIFATLLVFRAVTGPLAHLPGPLVSRLTNLQLKIAVVRGERVRYVHALHERYGPIVRIAPDEVSLADTSAARQIYKIGSPFVKTEWYAVFTGNEPERAIFTMTNTYQHGQHRRLQSFNFSEKWISRLEPYISKNVRLAVQRMAEDMQRSGFCDIFKWFTFMATDVIGEASFGESFRMLETGKKTQYIQDLETVGRFGIMRAEFPWLGKLMRRFPIGPAKGLAQIVGRLNSYAEESIQRYWRQLRENPDLTMPTLLTREFAAVEDGTITKAQIRRDAVQNIAAGTDTTALAATYAVWLLAHHPTIERALVREVATLPSDFVYDDLRSLNLLGNVLNETLRLCGPIGQGLPRFVPEGGSHFCGHFVPGGTIVGVQAYTLHRDPGVWTNPETFDPSRWDEPKTDMLHSFLPFGGGSRVCIGMHFAQLELRHALANFYRTFEGGVQAAFVDGFSEADMLPMGFFLSPPRGGRCLIERRK